MRTVNKKRNKSVLVHISNSATVIRLRSAQPRNQSSIPGSGRYLLLTKVSKPVLSPHKVLSSKRQSTCPGEKRIRCESNHSSSYTKAKNKWRCNFSPLYALWEFFSALSSLAHPYHVQMRFSQQRNLHGCDIWRTRRLGIKYKC